MEHVAKGNKTTKKGLAPRPARPCQPFFGCFIAFCNMLHFFALGDVIWYWFILYMFISKYAGVTFFFSCRIPVGEGVLINSHIYIYIYIYIYLYICIYIYIYIYICILFGASKAGWSGVRVYRLLFVLLSSGRHLGPSWLHLGSIWGHPGCILGPQSLPKLAQTWPDYPQRRPETPRAQITHTGKKITEYRFEF